MKIKRKVEMNLPQLLEWAWDNPKSSRNKRFVSENKEFSYVNQYVIFNEVSYAEIENSYCYGRNDLFTIEVEEEITEDTVIDNLYKMDEFYEFYSTEYKTIKDVIRHSVFKVKAVYLNNDLTMTLIWRDGRLVE